MENINIILPQMQALWQRFYAQQDFEQKRLLGIELAKILLEWEGQEVGGFQNPRDALKRIGGWQKVAECVCTQLPAINSTVESKKEALKTKLSELSATAEYLVSQLSHAQSELDVLQLEVENQQLLLDVKDAYLNTIKNKQQRVKEQICALHELSATIAELDNIKLQLADINTTLENGEDPVGYLQALTAMQGVREKLLNHYQVYQADNSTIAAQLLKLDAVQPVLAAIPNRLLALDNELKAIDSILQQQVEAQEKADKDIALRE